MERTGTWKELHPDQVIVSMIEFNGRVIIATAQQLFEFKDGNLTPIVFQEKT